jgi:hypothetical protein
MDVSSVFHAPSAFTLGRNASNFRSMGGWFVYPQDHYERVGTERIPTSMPGIEFRGIVTARCSIIERIINGAVICLAQLQNNCVFVA